MLQTRDKKEGLRARWLDLSLFVLADNTLLLLSETSFHCWWNKSEKGERKKTPGDIESCGGLLSHDTPPHLVLTTTACCKYFSALKLSQQNKPLITYRLVWLETLFFVAYNPQSEWVLKGASMKLFSITKPFKWLRMKRTKLNLPLFSFQIKHGLILSAICLCPWI